MEFLIIYFCFNVLLDDPYYKTFGENINEEYIKINQYPLGQMLREVLNY